MGPLPNLIYYSSVAKRGTHIIAEYIDGDGELPKIAAKCLEILPPYHSRFSYTTSRRMFACIIDESFLYCAIADEALSRSKVMSFLEHIKHEFISYARVHGLPLDQSRLEANCLDNAFDPVFRRLVSPFVGIPQKEKDRIKEELQAQRDAEAEADIEAGFEQVYPSAETTAYEHYDQSSSIDKTSGSRSPSRPLIVKTSSNKYKQKKSKEQARDLSDSRVENKGKASDKAHRLEIMLEGSSQSSPSTLVQKLGSMKSRGQPMARRMWWRNVKLVLLFDVIVCLILFGIWLGVCGGFKCTQKDNGS